MMTGQVETRIETASSSTKETTNCMLKPGAKLRPRLRRVDEMESKKLPLGEFHQCQ